MPQATSNRHWSVNDLLNVMGRLPSISEYEMVNCRHASGRDHARCGVCEVCDEPWFMHNIPISLRNHTRRYPVSEAHVPLSVSDPYLLDMYEQEMQANGYLSFGEKKNRLTKPGFRARMPKAPLP